MRLAKTSILYFTADVGTSIVGFLATLYFARVLGAEPLGKYFVVIALVGWMRIPTNGVAYAVNKRVSQGEPRDVIMTAAAGLSAAYWAAVSVVIVFAGRWIDDYVGAEVSLFLAAMLLANVGFTLAVEGLKGRKRVVRSGFLRTGDRVLRVASQVALVYLGYTVTGLVAGHVAGLAVSASVGLLLFRFRPSLPDREAVRSVTSYGRYAWIGELKGKSFAWMDTLILSLFVSSGLIGVYEVAYRLGSILILVSNAVEHTLFPEISDIGSEGDDEAVRDLLSEALFYAGIFVIPGFFGVLVLGPRLLRIYGEAFVKGAPVLLILIVARTVNVYEMQLLNVINGVDRPDVAFRINLVFVAANTVLNLALVYLYGWYGAAVATAVSSLVILVLSYRAVDRILGAPELPVAGVGKQVAAGAGMAVGVAGLLAVVPVRNMYVTVALVVAGAVIYGALLYALSGRIREKARSLAPG